MAGKIEYYLKVPKSKPSPLIFAAEYSKESRPRAWKSTDIKLQQTLPLLANADVTDIMLKDFDLVRIDMMLVK